MTETNELPDEVKELLQKEGFTVGEYIGKGSTSSVFKAKSGNEVVAIKVIDVNKQTDRVREKYLPREMSIVESVCHQFIIKTHRIVKHENKYVFIISDFADGGDLIGVMEKGEVLNENKVRKWFSQIVSAVAYLHSKGIAHRDLKADNILIHNGIAVLTDFGYASVSIDSNGKVLESSSLCGTLEYESPEAIARDKPYNPVVSDCFSLGVLLFTMITLEFPFGTGPEIRTQKGIQKLKLDIMNENWALPPNLSNNENLFSLLKQLLNPDVHSRVRSSQILSHPWFQI